jgi:hypothetical protein
MAAKKTSPAPGDNIKAEENRKVLFFDHAGKLMRLDEQLGELREQRKKQTGLAKADGIKAATLAFAIESMKALDEQKVVDKYIENGEVLDWLGLIPGFQPDLFKNRMPQDEKIAKAGECAGLTGKPRESGYGPSSREEQTWLAAFDAADKLRKERLADALEQAEKNRQTSTKATKAKAAKSKAGQPLDGDTPDSVKVANDDKPATPTPPRPDDDEGLTNSEKEARRQAEAMH